MLSEGGWGVLALALLIESRERPAQSQGAATLVRTLYS